MASRHRQIDSALIQWHPGIVRLTVLWSNGIQASSDWQRSDPMAYRHRQIDSALIQWHTGIVRLTALWSNGIQASLDWQRSDPMAYRHRQIDRALIQWHTGIVRLTALWSNGIQASSDWQYSSPMMLGIQWGGWQSYLKVTVPLLFTTLLKCSASTCAHWHPFSWWHPSQVKSSWALLSFHYMCGHIVGRDVVPHRTTVLHKYRYTTRSKTV